MTKLHLKHSLAQDPNKPSYPSVLSHSQWVQEAPHQPFDFTGADAMGRTASWFKRLVGREGGARTGWAEHRIGQRDSSFEKR